jgi:hypothetical protein
VPFHGAAFPAATKAMADNRPWKFADLSLIFSGRQWHREAGRMAGRQHGANFVVFIIMMARFRRRTIGVRVRRDHATRLPYDRGARDYWGRSRRYFRINLPPRA